MGASGPHILLSCLLVLCCSTITIAYWMNDLDHPCVRDCDAQSSPMTCEYDWTIESYYSMSRACYKCPFNMYDCHRPHCVPMAGYARPILSVNRKIPGPSIQVCENDIIKVHIHNRMQNEEASTIHWHGFHQRDTQHQDGVSRVTQCPVTSRQDFTYKFPAETPGTHWWHAHTGIHRGDGVFGSLVVRQTLEGDPNSGLYDRDDPHHVIVLTEWSKATAITIATASQHGADFTPNDGILINGRGTNQEFIRENNTTVTMDHHVVYVKPGLRYRFRIIGASNDVCPLTISVDDHPLTIIAMDGAPVKPVVVDGVTLFSGERYDFVLNANKKVDSYWIRVAGEVTCATHQEFAILRYDGTTRGVDPDGDKRLRVEGRILNSINSDSLLVADSEDAEEKQDDLSQVDVVHYLELDTVSRNQAKSLHHPVFYPYQRAGPDTYTSTSCNVINNVTLTMPSIPLLTHAPYIDEKEFCNAESLRRAGRDCSTEACECIHRIDLQYNHVVEIVLLNKLDVVAHPIHLHGYYLEILAMESLSKSITVKDFKRLDSQGKIHRNFKNPPRKDTIAAPKTGYVVGRFRADNPGWWLLHCHFDTHFLIGMGLVFHVDGHVPPPPDNMPAC